MTNYYWNSWYAGWGWFLWLGVCFLLFSSIGNWGYTYRAHRKFSEFGDGLANKTAKEILDERYARGEISHSDYIRMKSEIVPEIQEAPRKRA